MSDDVTNLAEVLAAHTHPGEFLTVFEDAWMFCGCGLRIDITVVDGKAKTGEANDVYLTHLAEQIAPLIAEARLIGEAMARTDAIAAHAELVERVEALIAPGMLPDGEELSEWVHVDDLRALIDPEATS